MFIGNGFSERFRIALVYGDYRLERTMDVSSSMMHDTSIVLLESDKDYHVTDGL